MCVPDHPIAIGGGSKEAMVLARVMAETLHSQKVGPLSSQISNPGEASSSALVMFYIWLEILALGLRSMSLSSINPHLDTTPLRLPHTGKIELHDVAGIDRLVGQHHIRAERDAYPITGDEEVDRTISSAQYIWIEVKIGEIPYGEKINSVNISTKVAEVNGAIDPAVDRDVAIYCDIVNHRRGFD